MIDDKCNSQSDKWLNLALSHKTVLQIKATQNVEIRNCSIQEGNILNIFLALQINASINVKVSLFSHCMTKIPGKPIAR